MRKAIRSFFLIALTGFAAGCGEDAPVLRTYVEFVSGAPSAAQAPAAPAASDPLTWTTPPGWAEQPAAGMRLATFTVDRDGESLECSIISLPGEVGTLEGNVKRWLGQLGVDPDPDALAGFVADVPALETAGGFTGSLVDLVGFPPDAAPAGPGMLAAILSRGGPKVFVKLTGPRAALEAERPAFNALCESLR